ncbi:MAG: pectin acetylesterase-family hydrolase [Pseudomonadota bacterium]
MATEVMPSGVTTYTFDGSNGGPICFTGSDYSMSTLDGSRSELMIFLQGGGVCAPDNCEAVEEAFPVLPPSFGILNAADSANPVSDYNLAYLPYCDGSLWMGDRDVDSNSDGSADRLFRGAQNLSAALDVVAGAYPAPNRIVIAGNSAGGFGTHAALPLVRKLYPNIPVELINDSGVGIMPDGFLELFTDYWNADAFFPQSCESCIGDDDNLTGYHAYQMDEDINLRVAFLSTKQDAVASSDGPEFERQLLEAINELHTAFPERFQSMIADGDGHTFIIRDFDRIVGGATVKQWLTDMLENDDDWGSVSD